MKFEISILYYFSLTIITIVDGYINMCNVQYMKHNVFYYYFLVYKLNLNVMSPVNDVFAILYI
jgi:hypothetical protein